MPNPRVTKARLNALRAWIAERTATLGLSLGQQKKLSLTPLLMEECEKRHPGLPLYADAVVIPYFTPQGTRTGNVRVRYKDPIPLPSGKTLRYAQPAGSPVEAYYPPFLPWVSLLEGTRPLWVTEGEFKAICATAHGFPCIGLGGVWSFSGGTSTFLPSLEAFAWKGRPVFVAFDSDVHENPHVRSARNSLCRELTRRGALPHLVTLPPLGEGKTGLDDFLIARGPEALVDLAKSAEPFATASALHALNEEVLYVTDPGLLIVLATGQRLTPEAFVKHAYADRIYLEERTAVKGPSTVRKSAAAEWLKWPERSTAPRLVYEPGQGQLLPHGEYNVWTGWGCPPAVGDVEPWSRLLDHLFTDCPTERAWFEQWCAYPVQHPGVKLYSCAVLWGTLHGTGKSLVGETLASIYGANAAEIDADALKSPFNEWAFRRQFIFGDEITAGESRRAADLMKSRITQRTLRVNQKYVPTLEMRDCLNYYFTSQHPDAFFLEDADRRYFVHEVLQPPLEPEFYTRYAAWLRGWGPSHLFAHLLSLPLDTFSPTAPALKTLSRALMIEDGRSDLGAWVATLRADPDRVLRVQNKVFPYVLWTADELRQVYDPSRTSRVTVNGLARELHRQGFLRPYRGQPVPTKVGGLRLWIVRNDVDGMLGMSGPEVAACYEGERSIDEALIKLWGSKA